MTTVAVIGTVTGCLPHVDERQVENVRPSLVERPVKTTSKRDTEPKISAEVVGNLVNVKLEQVTECSELVRSPMERETGTERSLKSGVLAQGINVAAAGLLVAGGVALYSAAGSGTCSKTAASAPQTPNPTSRPCTAEEEDEERRTDKTAGIVITSLAVIPVGLFVWNIVRAKDERKTVPFTKEETSGWSACGSRPLEGIHLTLKLAPAQGGSESRLSATTDSAGRASFDLSRARSSGDRAQLTALLPQGEQSAEVSLRGTPMRAASDAEAALFAKAIRDTAAIERTESAVRDGEAILSTLERTKEPWGAPQLEQLQELMSIWRGVPESMQSVQQPVDPSLTKRVEVLTPRVHRFLQRLNSLEPKVDRTIARVKREQDARNAAMWSAIFSGGGGARAGSAPSSGASNSDLQRAEEKRKEEQHQREYEDQRRREQCASRYGFCHSDCDNTERGCNQRGRGAGTPGCAEAMNVC